MMLVRGVRRSWDMARIRLALFRIEQHAVFFLKLDILLGNHDADAAGQAGYEGHAQEGDGITGHGEIQCQVRVCKGKIHPEHAKKRGQDAGAVAAGSTGNHDDGQGVYDGYICHIVAEVKKYGGY